MKQKIRRIVIIIIDKLLYVVLGKTQFAKYKGVKVGEGCRIYSRNFGSEPFLISIGNKVTITPGVQFITHDGSGWLFNDQRGRRFSYAPISIGNNVFIGVNSIIMPGVKIGNNVIVAAGSVVNRSVPDNSIIGGVPAKFIGDYAKFKEKVLNKWVSGKDLDYTLSYKERIMKIIDTVPKDYLKHGS